MWTPTTRRQHSREGLRYETDLTTREWRVIEPCLPAACENGRPREWPLREIVNAIFYVLRGGIAWRLLPSLPALADGLSLVCGVAGPRCVREDQPRAGHGRP